MGRPRLEPPSHFNPFLAFTDPRPVRPLDWTRTQMVIDGNRATP